MGSATNPHQWRTEAMDNKNSDTVWKPFEIVSTSYSTPVNGIVKMLLLVLLLLLQPSKHRIPTCPRIYRDAESSPYQILFQWCNEKQWYKCYSPLKHEAKTNLSEYVVWLVSPLSLIVPARQNDANGER